MASGIGGWFKGLVARGGTSQERWLPVDDQQNGFYNFRLMRFRSEGDLVRYPDYVWSSAGYWAARGGLSVHLEEVAERLDGVVYSDILILLNREDRQRSLEHMVRPWEEQLQALVEKQVLRMIDERGWRLAVPERPVRIHIVGDGEPAMGGHPLGLEEGEFATALLPNLYLGPSADSRPFAEVFVRVPVEAGGKGGFHSVGTFYDDQVAFTIGRHWLDNGQHQALPASALYTLHRYPGQEGVNHRLNVDLADEYRLQQTPSAQGDTITITESGSEMPVLEVMLISAEAKTEIASSVVRDDGLGTLIPDDMASMGGMTVIPEPDPDPSVILSRRSVLLQKIHFSSVMRGYKLDIGLDGTVAPLMSAPASRFKIEDGAIFLEPLRRDVTLDGNPLQMGRRVPMPGPEHTIEFANVLLNFTASAHGGDERWPYLGEVTVPAEPTELAVGAAYRIGRDRRKCEISLPDRAVSENILWHPSVKRDGKIRTRTGEIPVESFTSDSIMVAGRHAEIDLRGSEPKVRALSKVCPVFLRRRNGALLRLIAKEGAVAQPLQLGDDLMVGNTLFRVILPGIVGTGVGDYPPTVEHVPTDPEPSTPPSVRVAPPAAEPPEAGPKLPTFDSLLDPPEPEILEPEEMEALDELPSISHPRPVVVAVEVSVTSEPQPDEREARAAPPPRSYGALPRPLRLRLALPDLVFSPISLEEGLTVVDG